MALFVSTFINKIDRKGRVSVPASFRAALSQQSFQGFAAFPSFTAQAIEGYPSSFLENLAAASSESYDVFSPELDDINTLIFASAHQISFDPEGRIILPAELIAHANITDQAAFVGRGRTFQIWEPSALKARHNEARARAMANPPRITLKSGSEI
ncbi:MAG: division/cell wall cluster transcriptional repressor MraZ [Rhodospirillaceae bacterium]|nr:division/cell wall cluster transcriptional repressor MraZ [Rhodospirillaceae bacterium]MEA4838511.1 division/cell wall cluster transcriptional repressor MraZ [Rhodospirillaceae bacterium]